MINHNLDMVPAADWILDLGPEGGKQDGYIVADGTPEQVTGIQGSYTGKILKEAQ